LQDFRIVIARTSMTWSIATSANFAEPFPYAVRVSTADGGTWLSTNRVTGVLGEPITVSLDPVGVGQRVDVPVALFLPSSGK
jgi:hypothetical protein